MVNHGSPKPGLQVQVLPALLMFWRNFLILLSLLIAVKILLCAWRIHRGRDKLSLEYYLSIIEWEKEFLKIAFLALLAWIFS